MIMKIANMVKQWSKQFPGFFITVDNLIPTMLFFPISPETYDDNWDAEFEGVTSPGSRYNYPIFKGCTLREVKFTLRFDSSYPVGTNSSGKMVRQKMNLGKSNTQRVRDAWAYKYRKSSSFQDFLVQSHDMMVAVAVLEKLKLPKQGIATVAAGVMGGFTMVRPGVSDPAPPLTVLCMNPFKYLVGYLSKAQIKPEKYNKYMMLTRFSADCTFIVTPDYVFTTMEDMMREVNAISGMIL